MSRTTAVAIIVCLMAVAACSPDAAAGAPASPTPVPSPAVPPAPTTTAPAAPSAAAATLAAGTALPVVADSDPRILYTHLTGAGGGVFLMRPDGMDVVQLATDVHGTLKHSDWSANGQHAVFIDEATEKMCVAHLDGSPSESIAACDTYGCDYPAWSPDGTKIAFSRYENKDGITGPSAVGIYTVDLATGNVTTVVRLERPLLADVPRWSPDGTQIVFGVDRMDDGAYETGAAIAIVPAAGGQPRYLTGFEQFAYYPDWNRVTDEIVFSTEAIKYKKAPEPGDDTWNLYAIKLDGTGRRQITHVPAGKRLWNPTWTPDGTRITAGFEDTRQGAFVDPVSGEVEPFPPTDKMSRPRLRPSPAP